MNPLLCGPQPTHCTDCAVPALSDEVQALLNIYKNWINSNILENMIKVKQIMHPAKQEDNIKNKSEKELCLYDSLYCR